MAFRVRYVPLSPQSSMPRAKTSDTELEPFKFVPLSQDIINKAKKRFDDLINELCPLIPTPVQTSFDQVDLSTFASTSTFPFDDMQVSAPISQLNLEEQQKYFSFLEQNQEPEPTAFSSAQDSSDVQMDMDTTMEELASFGDDMTWNLTDEQLLVLGSWEISPDTVFSPEAMSELDALVAATDQSCLENMRKQMDELERQFYGEQAQIPSESSNESK